MKLWSGGRKLAFQLLFLLLSTLFISSSSIEGLMPSPHSSGTGSVFLHNNRQQKLDLIYGLKGLYDDHTRLFDFGVSRTATAATAAGNRGRSSSRHNCTHNLSLSFHKTSESRAQCIKIARSKIISTFAPIMADVGPRGFYMDPATHFNLGDQILVASSAYMLQYFKKRMVWCKGTQTFRMNVKQCTAETFRLATKKATNTPNGKGVHTFIHSFIHSYTYIHTCIRTYIRTYGRNAPTANA